MKKVLITVSALFACACIFGQSSQKKVLLQQIAALKVYGGYVQKGYSIARKGLNTISDFKDGEFSLHSTFFSALATVNPNIAGYDKIAKIIGLQLKILKQRQEASDLLYDDLYLGNERQYAERVFGRLMADCRENLDQLLVVLSDSSLVMEDSDRLARIDYLHGRMLDNYAFSKSFSAELEVLLASRQQDQNDINKGRVLNKLTAEP
ncbi:hypothetical protein [Flavobacterium beibuense]|uniref:TerB family tellurite resistance protein n=1 Tax=Flavobacterium beibuense TaxID=657326 RepID=A0A444WEQ4_9FLAO|nr:hypothetical protein [Flavobacterium beibuense]RYJ44307.1 hypothetical protein NU09_0917 [Flavobacterium beibuense]